MAAKKTTPKKSAKKKSAGEASAKKKAGASKPSKKAAAKKKPVAKKPVAKKGSARRPVAKSSAKKSVAKKKAPAKKAVAKKAVAKRAPAQNAVAKTPVVKKAAPKRAAPKPPVAIQRRDHAGHIDPEYAAQLREQSGRGVEQDRAFFAEPRSGDSLAEELGEEAVVAMTSGEDDSDSLEAVVDEEQGGPFVETDGSEEFADGVDESNPEEATREPFPIS